ncbi:DUF1906 domain-containing protein [Streptomyces pactum]|nr:glycoside hydrolase domain-containing protein [Streptomyces pactum]
MDRQKGIIRYVVGLCAALTGLAVGSAVPATASVTGAVPATASTAGAVSRAAAPQQAHAAPPPAVVQPVPGGSRVRAPESVRPAPHPLRPGPAAGRGALTDPGPQSAADPRTGPGATPQSPSGSAEAARPGASPVPGTTGTTGPAQASGTSGVPETPLTPAAPEAPGAPEEEAEARVAGMLPDPQVYGARIFKGRAFDTCHAPSLATLRAWRSSPYRAVGIYYGGRGRHCVKQPLLSRAWALGARELGWELLPVYVGSQSPCVRNKSKWDVRMGSRPWEQGRREGRDAVRRAQELGMIKRSALYLDMEAYDRKNTKCARSTLQYIRGWNREVRSRGYFPGFYSSANSGIRHLESARRSGVRDLPSAMWFARWGKKAALYGEPALSSSAWHPHRRIHQYAGNVGERHGGRTLRIDRNLVDAPVAIVR